MSKKNKTTAFISSNEPQLTAVATLPSAATLPIVDEDSLDANARAALTGILANQTYSVELSMRGVERGDRMKELCNMAYWIGREMLAAKARTFKGS